MEVLPVISPLCELRSALLPFNVVIRLVVFFFSLLGEIISVISALSSVRRPVFASLA